MNEAFSDRKTPQSLVSRQAINRASEVFQQYNGCFLHTPTQVFQHIRTILNDEQKARFHEAINTEGTTQGVANYNSDSVETLSESAKTLSLSSYTIVISEEAERNGLHSNTRIISITPTEFLSYCDEARSLSDALSMSLKDSAYPDYLILVLFRKDVLNEIKKTIKM